MAWFGRKPVASGTFRVLGATREDGTGRLVLNGMPQAKVHVSGLLQVEGRPPQATSYDGHFGVDEVPEEGAVVPADVEKWEPLKIRIHWQAPAAEQQAAALRNDAAAQVVQDVLNTGRADHTAGASDALGIAMSDPAKIDSIADQLASALGTPISVDVDEGGAKRHITVGGGGHLSSADAAELQRSGTAATATVTAAQKVDIPAAMMPNAEASLWDLDLDVHRADGTSYPAQTRVGFISEARRQVLGMPGLEIPVRVDPQDDSRVAVDSASYDAQHPDAPHRM